MRVSVFFVITASFFVNGQTNEPNLITILREPIALFDIESYRNRICANEPTCNLINDATPKEYTGLDYRNCMCDADCSMYGDCCLDSKYYNKTEQKQHFNDFNCSFQESVYMKTSCPKSYNDTAIKNKCEKSTLRLEEEEIALIIPVTNVNTGITYGNKYCAQCHGERSYQPWNEARYCYFERAESYRPDDFQQNYPIANLDNDTLPSVSKLYRVENFTDLTEGNTSSSPLNDLYEELDKATKYIKFNSTSKTFYSFYNNKNFTCSFGRAIPKELESSIRRCKTSVSQCSDVSNKTLTEKCQSYTSIVFYKYSSYRNTDCAACNGVTDTLTGCFSSDVSFSSASNLFSTNDKVVSAINPCKNSALKDKFC